MLEVHEELRPLIHRRVVAWAQLPPISIVRYAGAGVVLASSVASASCIAPPAASRDADPKFEWQLIWMAAYLIGRVAPTHPQRQGSSVLLVPLTVPRSGGAPGPRRFQSSTKWTDDN